MTNGQDYGWRPQQGYGQQHGDDQTWQVNQYDPGTHRQRIGGPQPPYPPQGTPQPPYPQEGAQWQQPGYGPPGYGPQPYPGQPYYPRDRRSQCGAGGTRCGIDLPQAFRTADL
jgi:hypothetical protein